MYIVVASRYTTLLVLHGYLITWPQGPCVSILYYLHPPLLERAQLSGDLIGIGRR